MSLTRKLRRLLWRRGYDIVPYTPKTHPVARRKRLIEVYGVDLVLDVGANTGQYARELRNDLGYAGRISSFEPLTSAYQALAASASGDSLWETFNLALGDVEGQQKINIAGNSYSSSLLGMLPSHLRAAPESRFIGTETIEVRTLDSLFEEVCRDARNIYLKLDAQGFESRILRGAEVSLPRIGTVQLEMSLVPLYENEVLFFEMCAELVGKGYRLVSVEPGFSDPSTGQLLQLDGIFHRA